MWFRGSVYLAFTRSWQSAEAWIEVIFYLKDHFALQRHPLRYFILAASVDYIIYWFLTSYFSWAYLKYIYNWIRNSIIEVLSNKYFLWSCGLMQLESRSFPAVFLYTFNIKNNDLNKLFSDAPYVACYCKIEELKKQLPCNLKEHKKY